MALLRRRSEWPEHLSMLVTDVFFVELQGKGTVIIGQLAGEGALRPGDLVLHDGRELRITAIEVFKANLKEAGPSRNVGLVLGVDVPPRGFEQARLGFRRA